MTQQKQNRLQFDHIAPYLPYGVDMITLKSGIKRKLTGLSCQNDNSALNFIFGALSRDQQFFNYIPVLHPLSDLTEQCWTKQGSVMTPECLLHEGRQLSPELTKQINSWKINMYDCPTWLHKQLLEWHFDVNNLIGQDLAYNINNL